ncbi:MAG: DUF6261 family protein [Capnocytophaga sp.]|nr:DUF6261 family protein [Capnocytophaga sp.]
MKITLSKLSTKELATLAESTISISKNVRYTFLADNELLKKLEETFGIYRTLYNKVTFSGKGKTVAQADKNRTKEFNNFRDYLKGYAGIALLANNNSAKELYAILKVLGASVTKLTYAAKTAHFRRFIEEFSQEKNKQRLSDIGLTEVFEEFKNVQKEFDEVYSDQIATNSELRSTPSATKNRTELETFLNAYFVFIRAMQKNENWKALYSEINELIKSLRPNDNKTEKKSNKEKEPEKKENTEMNNEAKS